MKNKLFAVLGFFTAIAALTNPVSAQTRAPSSTATGDVTLSGDSLDEIETRTIQDDYNKFFAIEPPNNLSANDAGNVVNLLDPEVGSLQVSEDVEVIVNQPLVEPISPVPFRDYDRFYEGVDRVEVEVDLTE